KGTELIPQIANKLREKNPTLKFKILIVGISTENEYIKAILLDINKLNLNDYIELVYQTKHPLNYLDISDACIITSREESFSLVGIQASMLKKPIINFKNANGLSEFLTEECTFQ